VDSRLSVLTAFAAALVLVPVARWAGRASGLVDDPAGNPLKIHRKPVSVLGGVAVLLAALLPVHPQTGVVVAVAIALGAGLLDDVYPLSPLLQGALQTAAGVALAVSGQELAALAVLLVVACANGVNFLDGQDGLAGGLAAVAGATLAALTGSTLGYALAAALAAFLLWNALGLQLFLGNGGAYGIGALLAVLAVDLVARAGVRGACAALLCLGVFACELGYTVLRRAGSGQVTAGDRLHSYDVLAEEVGSRLRSTLVFWALGGAGAGLAVAVYSLPLPAAVGVTAAAFGCVALAARMPALQPRRARSYVG
jgi:UDP-GlcNAc:undecaprenyl-phosphate GlcNAc-1-phosphate transferase